jgi:hypothetical protein
MEWRTAADVTSQFSFHVKTTFIFIPGSGVELSKVCFT